MLQPTAPYDDTPHCSRRARVRCPPITLAIAVTYRSVTGIDVENVPCSKGIAVMPSARTMQNVQGTASWAVGGGPKRPSWGASA